MTLGSDASETLAITQVLADWHGCGKAGALATVVTVEGSAPRSAGSRLVISEEHEVYGSVSGGCVESDVCRLGLETIRTGRPHLVSYGATDEEAWELGLPCGGQIEVLVERPDLDLLLALRDRLANQQRAAALTVIDGPGAGEHAILTEEGLMGGGPRVRAMAPLVRPLEAEVTRVFEDAGTRLFLHAYHPPFRLVVYGAVGFAEHLCRLARALGWEAIVADARPAFAKAERIPSADRIVCRWPLDAAAEIQIDADTAVVVLTHDPKFDIPALMGALASEAFYIGALGSRRTQERRRARLLDAGVEPKEVGRIHGPSGLDIGGRSEEETALSIIAEVVAVRNGRGGGPLRHSHVPIHGPAAS